MILIVVGFIMTFNFFKPKNWLPISDHDKFSGKSWEKQLTISIFDYLPIYAKLPPNKKAPELPEVLAGKVEFIEYKKGSDFQTGKVLVEEDAKIRLPLFDFPGMKVWLDDKVVEHNHDDCSGEEYCLGLINFYLPKGEHIIKAELTDTPIRAVGNIISLVSILAIAGIFVWTDKNKSA